MKIGAIFSDYDGTLSPMRVPREEAFIPPKLLHLLVDVGRRIPIAVITTKDLGFVKDRAPFAHAIAAIGGLELQIGMKGIVDERILDRVKIMKEAYQAASDKINSGDEIFIERKDTSEGVLVAFCLDWRLARDRVKAQLKVEPILSRCKETGLYVVRSEYSPFADVYAAEVNKGRAFARLKKELKVNKPIMYWGDSEMDNPAFKLADVSIAIKHQESPPHLQSKYSLPFEALPRFVSDLLAANLNFTPSMITSNP